MVNREAIFQDRHIGPTPDHIKTMLKETGFNSLDELLDKTVPGSIHFRDKLNLPPALTEEAAQAELKDLANKKAVHQVRLFSISRRLIKPLP